jgi:hypothetical protein
MYDLKFSQRWLCHVIQWDPPEETETDLVSETLFSSYLEFRTVQSPEIQWFWVLYNIVRTV